MNQSVKPRYEIHTGPVAAQYEYDPRENIILPEEMADPIGDEAHSPVKGIVHRYPDRLLLKITDTCAVYCRFCFRKEMVGKGQGVLSAEELGAALTYISGAKEVREVILTGGDPLTLSNRRLKNVLHALHSIDHIDVVRFHTRTPLVKASRVDDELCALLRDCKKAVYIALHVNHENELTREVISAIKRLDQSGAVLLSQSVLLKHINDNVSTLENLFYALVKLKVKPYYLHHPDMAPGTSHFRLSIEEGQALISALRARVSGLCLPTYVLDIPGGYGKMPLEKCAYEQTSSGHGYVTDRNGALHFYPPQKRSEG